MNELVVVPARRVDAWCVDKSGTARRVMACAPSFTAASRADRALVRGVRCASPSCFACSDVEFGCTLAYDGDERTRDQLFVPVAFRSDTVSGLTQALAVLLVRGSAPAMLAGVPSPLADAGFCAVVVDVVHGLEVVDMRRFRGLCSVFIAQKTDGASVRCAAPRERHTMY